MSKTIMIPKSMNPFELEINGKKYSYPAGTEQEVPDEVAALIEENEKLAPEPEKAEYKGYDLVISYETDGGDALSGFSIIGGSYERTKEKAQAGVAPKILVKCVSVYGDEVISVIETIGYIQSAYGSYLNIAFMWTSTYYTVQISSTGISAAFKSELSQSSTSIG